MGYRMKKLGQMVLKVVNRVHRDTIGSSGLERSQLDNNAIIRSYGLERSQLGTQR